MKGDVVSPLASPHSEEANALQADMPPTAEDQAMDNRTKGPLKGRTEGSAVPSITPPHPGESNTTQADRFTTVEDEVINNRVNDVASSQRFAAAEVEDAS